MLYNSTQEEVMTDQGLAFLTTPKYILLAFIYKVTNVSICFVGALLNTLVMFISVKGGIAIDARYFLGGLAMADMLYCGYTTFQMVVDCKKEVFADTFLCKMKTEILGSVSFFSMLGQTAMIALNRYISICRSDHTYDVVFDSRRKLIAWTVAPFVLGSILFNIEGPTVVLVGLVMEVATTVMVYRIYVKVSKHKKMMASLSNAARASHEKDTEFLRAVVAQQAIVFGCTVPYAVAIVYFTRTANFDWEAIFIVVMIFGPISTMNVMLDPLSTLFIVKPYKKAAMAILRGEQATA